jgi:hypothetical protein
MDLHTILPIYGRKSKKAIITVFFSQAEYLHDEALVYESFTGIDHWWIGLSDVGRF